MHVDIFLALGAITAIGAVLVWIVQRFGQSAILAYLALGIAVGPSGFHLLPPSADVNHLAELGVVALLFFVGLEFHLSALRETARLALLGGFLQIGGSTALVAVGALALGWPAGESALVAFCAALSSTAIVLKSFEERRESDSMTATVCIAILIGQDLFALAAMVALPLILGSGAAGGPSPLVSIAILLVGLPILFFASRRLLPILFRRTAVARNQEAFALWSLASLFLVAIGARALGASMPLGAFLGGLVLAETPYAHQIRADLAVIRNLALAFFFLTVGMLVDLRFLAENAFLLLGVVAAVLAAKTVVTALAIRALKNPWNVSAGAGLALSQIGEFALVLPAIAYSAGFLAEDRYQLLIAATVLTMAVAPLSVAKCRSFGRRVGKALGGKEGAGTGAMSLASASDEKPEAVPPMGRAIVIGYGPVGRTLSKILLHFGVVPTVVDLNVDTIQRLRSIGREGVFGDASQRDVLLAAGVREARFLFVTLPDYRSRVPIIGAARAINRELMILTRARYLNEQQTLEGAGADIVAIEECEVALELARELLRRLDVAPDVLEEELERIRQEIAVRTGFTMVIPRTPTPGVRIERPTAPLPPPPPAPPTG